MSDSGPPGPHIPPGGACPTDTQIERLAAEGTASEDMVAHVRACSVCAARMASARDDLTFLSRVRELTGNPAATGGVPRIAGYKSFVVLSAGAQGVVYKAVQESTLRAVAVKTLAGGRLASARQRVRAEREAEIAARLRHPNIVTIFESRTLWDGQFAVVMEFVDGVPLDQWTPPGLTASERRRAMLSVFECVCSAIHHAHLNGVIHRDLKPDNILVTADGRPVVLDFGIAKLGGLHTTITRDFAGTPAYASPEQVMGRADEVDGLTDVYSLGVILYRLMCGAMPYELEGSIFEMARTIEEQQPAPPRSRDPALPRELEAIVMRAIRKDKRERYRSAAALAQDVERYLSGEPVEAMSESGWYVMRKAVAMNRRRLAMVAGAAAVVLGAGIAVAVSASRAAESARKAELDRQQARAEGVRARAVTELLREALPNTDPANPEIGYVVGAGLGRLYYRLETGGFEDDPEVDQAIRRLWGEVYTGFGGKALNLVEYSEVSLRNGLVRLRQEHTGDHPEIAATLHNLAGVVLLRRRPDEAEVLCRDALAMRERLSGSGAASTAESRALLARVLLADERPQDAIAQANQALVVLRTLPHGDGDLPIAAMLSLHAHVLLGSGSTRECEPLLREAMLLRIRRLPPDDPDVLASLADAARLADEAPDLPLSRQLALAWAGTGNGSLTDRVQADIRTLLSPDRRPFPSVRPSGRTVALGRTLALATALLDKDEIALVGILTAQMRAAESEGIEQVKVDAALRAASILEEKFGAEDSTVMVCLDQAAVTLALMGHADRAVELVTRTCAARARVPAGARDPLIIVNGLRHKGWFLSLAGRSAEAVPVFREMLAETTAAVGERHHLYALGAAGLACALVETGDMEGAEIASADALHIAEPVQGKIHRAMNLGDQMAHVKFARGHVLVARAKAGDGVGRLREAMDLLEFAWDAYYGSLPAEYAWKQKLKDDAVWACEAMGEVAAAQVWRER